MSQLDLFGGSGHADARPPLDNLVRFPLGRRRKKIITTARTLEERKTDEGKASYWQRTCLGLSAELRRHGATADEVTRQLEDFRRAVQIEIDRGPGERISR